MTYDYREDMKEDIKAAVKEYFEDKNITLTEDNYDDVYEDVYEYLWIDDSVTGNGSGSYTFNRYKAKEYVTDNMDLLGEMINEFCLDAKTIGEKFIAEDWEYFDVSIRCYLLGEILPDVLPEMIEG